VRKKNKKISTQTKENIVGGSIKRKEKLRTFKGGEDPKEKKAGGSELILLCLMLGK